MKIVLLGASGMIGSRVLAELLSRGHTVTVLARYPEKISAQNVTAIKVDALDAESIAAGSKGADILISAYGPPQDRPQLLIEAVQALIKGLELATVHRVLMVGGAGSLFVAPGVDVIDSGHLPEKWRDIAIAHREALALLKASSLEWTYFSPAGIIEPGERTGKFRLGTDSLITDEKGNSTISAEDYAIALVDEVEHPRHIRQRFTIGY